MKAQGNGLFRFILILILALALIRFSPIIVRLIQAAAIGVRGYWWAIIPVLVISGALWRMMRRGSLVKKSEVQFENQSLRDVTNSSEGKSE